VGKCWKVVGMWGLQMGKQQRACWKSTGELVQGSIGSGSIGCAERARWYCIKLEVRGVQVSIAEFSFW